MGDWELWKGDYSGWDLLCEGLKGSSVFQSFGWGEHQREHGWIPLRLVYRGKGENYCGSVQLLRRSMPLHALSFYWCPGGPSGEVSLLGEDFQKVLSGLYPGKPFYLRLSFCRPSEASDIIDIRRLGWAQPRYRMLSGLSFRHLPLGAEEEFLKNCTGNWRHNLRRGLKKPLEYSLWENPDPDEMLHVYQKMEQYKGLSSRQDAAHLKSLLRNLGPSLLVCRARTPGKETLAFRAAALQGGKAWDLLAASGPEARKNYATYVLYTRLLDECRRHGAREYDLGGIDPAEAEGVYHFKKGTGASPVHYLGEWELASSPLTGRLCNALIRWKTRSRSLS